MKKQLLLLSSIFLFSYSAFSQIPLVKELGGSNNLSKSVLSPPLPPTIRGICCDSPPIKLWDKRFGGAGRDFLYSSIACLDGGYLLGGDSNSPQGGDKSQPSQGDKDYWVVKIDVNGAKVWDKRFGGMADDFLQSMLATSDGGYLLGGYSGSDQNGDRSQSLQGYYDYWVVKIDANGTKLWDRRFGGTSISFLRSMVATPDGGYLLGGYSDSPQGGDKSQDSQGENDYWVVKIDANGTKVWDKRFGGPAGESLQSMVATPDGGYLLGGYSDSPQGGDKSQDSQGESDYWVVKIDAAGTKMWDRRFGGTAIDHFASMVATTDGSYLLGGYSTSPQGGDKSQGSQGSQSSSDYWVVKIDANGAKIWDKRFGGRYSDYLQNMVATSDGGYLLGGYSDSPQGGDKSQGSQSSGWSDYWVVKIDANGMKAWDKRFGGTLGEFLQSVVATPDGSYLLAGASNSGQNGDRSQASQGDLDYWLVKTTAATNLSGTVCAGSSVTLQASGCSGTVTWSTGTIGPSLVITPTTSTTYTATCTLNGSTSEASNLVMLTVSCGADLTVSMQVNTRTPKVGDIVSYSVSVVNRGPLPATNVRLTDILPVGLEYHSSASGGVSTSSNSLTIDLGTIAIGSTNQVAFNTVVTSAGTFVNGIQIQSVDQPDPTSLPGSGIADGEDDAALVDFRTRDLTGPVVVSANPNQRTLPLVVTNQPAPGDNEADLSLAIQVDNQVPVIGSALSVTLLVANRGLVSSGNVVVSLTMPGGWQWGSLSGWTVNGQSGTATISDIASGTMSALVISVMPGGIGAQQLKAEIISAVAPDIDSSHGNGALNRGEDDEASVTVRVR